jgi:hypothetical protein
MKPQCPSSSRTKEEDIGFNLVASSPLTPSERATDVGNMMGGGVMEMRCASADTGRVGLGGDKSRDLTSPSKDIFRVGRGDVILSGDGRQVVLMSRGWARMKSACLGVRLMLRLRARLMLRLEVRIMLRLGGLARASTFHLLLIVANLPRSIWWQTETTDVGYVQLFRAVRAERANCPET